MTPVGSVVVRTDRQKLAAARDHHVMAFRRAREECIGLARRNAPKDRGFLAASITDDGPPHVTPATIRGRFGSAARHARMREFGGTIRPVRKKALSWVNREGVRFVVGPGIPRNFSKIDKVTGQRVVFIRKASITQLPGGPHQGYKPFIRPAGEKFREFFFDHLRAGGW